MDQVLTAFIVAVFTAAVTWHFKSGNNNGENQKPKNVQIDTTEVSLLRFENAELRRSAQT